MAQLHWTPSPSPAEKKAKADKVAAEVEVHRRALANIQDAFLQRQLGVQQLQAQKDAFQQEMARQMQGMPLGGFGQQVQQQQLSIQQQLSNPFGAGLGQQAPNPFQQQLSNPFTPMPAAERRSLKRVANSLKALWAANGPPTPKAGS